MSVAGTAAGNVARLLLWGAALVGLVCGSAVHVRAENWPGFRGPTGQGISNETQVPIHWSATENIAWKMPVPGEGWSSPIVWGDRVFVTTVVDETSCRVLCFERPTGKLQWNVEVGKQTPRKKRQENSYASPTPVTDGERVMAVYGDGLMACVDVSGKLLWTNHDVQFYSHHGLGASPLLDGDRFLMPFDGSSDGPDNKIGWKTPWDKATLLTLDKKTGKPLWRGERGLSRISHVTPVKLHDIKQPQIISNAGDVVQGFDPETGKRLWSVYSQGEGVTPSLVIGEGLIFASSGFEKPTIRAIRPDGSGEVTKTHIVWEQIKGCPTTSSLLYVKPHLYAVTDAGVVTCYRAATGDVVWQDRIGGKHWASPVYAAGKIFFLSEQGEATVLEAGPEFKVLAKNAIGEKCQASLAVSQGQIFLRTAQHLYAIGK